MHISADRQHKLRTLFAALPACSLDRLEYVFQQGQDSGDKSLPYAEILNLMPKSVPEVDLEQVFYPVSLLLGDQEERPDRVSLAVLRNLWKMFEADEAYRQVAERQGRKWDWEKFRAPLVRWLRGAYEAEGGKARLRKQIGMNAAEKLPMVMSLLSFASEIRTLVEDWPLEVKDLGDDILIPLRDMHDLLIDVDSQITPYLLFLLYARLRRPQEILRAVTLITRQHSDMMLIMTNLKILPDVMGLDAEETLARIAQPFLNPSQSQQLDDDLRYFAGIVAGSGEEFDIRPQGNWGKRLAHLAGQSQLLWKRKLDQCVRSLQKVTPRSTLKAFLGGEVTTAKTVTRLDPADVHKAEMNILEVKIAFSFASRLGIASLRDKYAVTFERRLSEQVDNLIDLMADPGDADPSILQDHFSALVRLTRAYHGREEAEVLQRRGMAVAA